MQEKGTIRTIPMLLALNVVTCGLYYIYWIYQTSYEIKRFTEKDNLYPIIDVLLGIVTCGLYFKYWYYKYGKIVYKEMPLKVGMDNKEDKTLALVIIDIAVFLIYFFNLIFNSAAILIAYSHVKSVSDYMGLLGNYFSLLPLGLIYSVNISSLIMQDKLNNIWKKAD